MSDTLFIIAGRPVGVSEALYAAAALAAAFLLAALVALLRARAGRRAAAEAAAAKAAEMEARLQALLAQQAEMSGRMQTIAEIFGSRQADLTRALSERLDGMTQRLNHGIGEAAKNTHDNLKQLHERLAVLDAAQRNITDLTGQVTTLANILGNKQARGAFGQARMEAIVADGLPSGAYAFQATLKSGHRPDCLIFMPNGAPPLAIDAKFPLEAYNALKAAATPEAAKAAQQQFRTDLSRHVKDIAERYLAAGETQDTAFMFVPSESLFAELHENFDDVVQRAYRARIVVVSPSLLLLSIQVIQAVLRDQRLREQAHVIQAEVVRLMEDVGRLDDRVRKLAGHFATVQKDVEQILISSDKVTARGRRIEAIGVGEAEAEPPRLLAGQ